MVDYKMVYNVYVQHFDKLHFDENSKMKPNQLQILNIIRQAGKKVVPSLQSSEEYSTWRITYGRGELLTKK
jgi:hypothetical protein